MKSDFTAMATAPSRRGRGMATGGPAVGLLVILSAAASGIATDPAQARSPCWSPAAEIGSPVRFATAGPTARR